MVFGLLNAVGNQQSKVFNVKQSSESSVLVNFHMENYKQTKETIDGKSYSHFENINSSPILTTGKPELPFFSTYIQLPNTGTVSVDYSVNKVKEFQPENQPYPSQGAEYEDLRTGFSLDQNYYGNGGEFPNKLVSIGEPKIIRGVRVAALHIYPLHFNATENKMINYEDISISLSFNEDETGINEITNQRNSLISKSFENVFSGMVANYQKSRTVFQNPSALIIYNSTLAIDDLITNLAEQKRRKGFEVTIANQDICGTSTTSIKNYIQNAYDTWDNPPEFIILVGDVNGSIHVPAWSESFSGYGAEGDVPYVQLEGNDTLPDAFIGRISVASITQLQTYLNKEIRYETSPLIAGPDWMNHSLLVGDTSPSGNSCIFTVKYAKELLLQNDPTSTFTELYGGDPSPNQMNMSLNNGSLFFYYRGWIGMSGWGESNISSLTNTNKLFNAVIITCDTGSYGSGTSRTEMVIRAGTPGNLKGGISAIGMVTPHTHTTFNNILSGGISYGLVVDSMRTMGEAINMGRYALHMAYDDSNPSQANTFSHWINLMGDPSVQIYVTIPKVLHTQFQSSLPSGSNSILINVTDENNAPLPNAKVTLYQSESNLSVAGNTDENGAVRIYFDPNTTGEVFVTTTKDDYVQKNESVILNGSPTISMTNIEVDDSQSGNNNQQLNPGETDGLTIFIKNFTSETISGLNGVLTTDDEYVEIQNSTQNFGSIESGSTIGIGGFEVIVSPNCPNNHQITFLLSLTDNNSNDYQSYSSLQSLTGDAEIISYQIDDGANNLLDPGETGNINFTIKNVGTEPLSNVYARLVSLNNQFIVNDSIAYFGDINPNESINCSSDQFSYETLTQLIVGQKLQVKLIIFNNSGYQEMENCELLVGNATLTDPLGPDNYGYVCYDDGDTTYEDCPVYDWIEIDPTQGGLNGTSVNLSDNGDNQDDVTQIDLPFTFNFYGISYNTLSICSNGWVSFLPTEQAQFRNWRIPGPLGPGAMIAAFWDDLYGGDVYTYYMSAEHKFVIEWSNVNNAGGGNETFEIILYDPQSYPTITEDGPIKIQYKNWVSQDTGSSSTHGNYCTVGIEDHTQTRGLEYTYNNEYPTTAKSLGNETAIFFTGLPLSPDGVYLSLGNILLHDQNESGYLDAGETADLGVSIRNIGMTDISNVQAVLSTSDSYTTLNNSTSTYSFIQSGHAASNQTYFNFSVSPDCPANHNIEFHLDLTAGNYQKNISFSIEVNKASIDIGDILVWDGLGNNNGIADPGETIEVIIPVQNNSYSNTGDINIGLSSSNQHISITNGLQTIDNIPIESTLQVSFEVNINANCPNNENVELEINISGENITTQNSSYNLGIGFSSVASDFEDDNGGLIANTGWAWGTDNTAGAHSGTKVWGTVLNGNYGNNVNYNLDTPEIMIPAQSSLQFYHKYSFESNYDGGQIQISTNGGNSFQTLMPNEGYPDDGVSAVQGPCYTGTIEDWQLVTVDLAQYGSNNIIVRWHMASDVSVTDPGWYIDDLTINMIPIPLSKISGNIQVQGGNAMPAQVIVSAGDNSTSPDADGDYKIFVTPNSYDILTDLPGYEDGVYENINCQSGVVVGDKDFVLHYLTPVSDLTYSMNPNQGESGILLNWDEITDRSFINYEVYKQKASGTFVKISNPSENSYYDTDVQDSHYRYYIVAAYSNGKSEKSNVADLDYSTTANNDINNQELVNSLKGNYPNPFNPETTIKFSTAKDSKVSLKIYNIKGQLVKTLVNENLNAGTHQIVWKGKNNNNKSVSSGVYLYRLKSNKYVSVKKAILLK
jgi:hypothetical protein